MKPQFVVVSRLDYTACCGMARQLLRYAPGARALRLMLWCVAGLCGSMGGIIALLRSRAQGGALGGAPLVYLLPALLLVWLAADGMTRIRGYFLLRDCRLQKLARRRYEIFEDGIAEEELPPDGLPFFFASYRHFAEDRQRFYLQRDGKCLTFDKRGFTIGTAAEFRLFLKKEMQNASLFYDMEDEST